MSNPAQGFNTTVTLGRLVSKVMGPMRLTADDESNLYDYAEDFLRDLNNDTFTRIEVFRATYPIPNNVILWPTEMMGWAKIGYESGSQVVPLGNNDNLAFNDKISITPNPNQVDDITLPESFYRLFWPKELPRTPVPTFRVDYHARKIYIDPQVKIPNFYMEFISSCLNIEKGLLVHPFYQTGLLLHMMFWISIHTPSRRADAPMYKDMLAAETERYRDRTAPTSLDILTAFSRVY